MTESRTSFKTTGFDSYSAWTDFGSIKKQYKTVTQSQVTPTVLTFSPIPQTSNPAYVIQVA
jgi:hypothetical protein